MKSMMLFRAAGIAVVGSVVACGGDDIKYVGLSDAGGDGSTDATTTAMDGTSPVDAATPIDANMPPVDASTPVPSRLLATMNNSATSELIALNLSTATVDGTLVYPGFIGATYAQGTSPYVLGEGADFVARLDSTNPWVIDSSWNIALNDFNDAGAPYSDPTAVITAGTKSYVLRYTRNEIAVIDSTQVVDAGAPLKTIDLTPLQQAGDTDGTVEMTGGVYVASRNIVYVVLGNIDRTKVVDQGFDQLCTSSTPSVIGIDVATDTILDLNGAAPGMAWQLTGYGAAQGLPTVYDSVADRILVLETGCYVSNPLIDAGSGAFTKRGVEAISLVTGATTTLFDGSSQQFPDALIYIDAHHAVLGFGGSAYPWDPTGTSLGTAIPNAPDFFVYDGAGNLVGTKTIYGGDSGFTAVGTSIIRVSIASGAVTTLAMNPWTDSTGFVGGVDIWPKP